MHVVVGVFVGVFVLVVVVGMFVVVVGMFVVVVVFVVGMFVVVVFVVVGMFVCCVCCGWYVCCVCCCSVNRNFITISLNVGLFAGSRCTQSDIMPCIRTTSLMDSNLD